MLRAKIGNGLGTRLAMCILLYSFSFCGSGKFYCSSYGETLLRVLGEMLEHDDLEVCSLLYRRLCLLSVLVILLNYVHTMLVDTILRQWDSVQSPLFPYAQGRS